MKTFPSWSEKRKQAYDTNVDIKSVLKLIKHLSWIQPLYNWQHLKTKASERFLFWLTKEGVRWQDLSRLHFESI